MTSVTAKAKEETDLELIQKILQGQSLLFGTIMQRYNRRLYRIARGMNIADVECEDIMQQAYIKAYEHLASFRAEAGFSTWLSRILINECLIYKRKKQLVLDNDNAMMKEDSKPEGKSHYSPENVYIRKELKNALESAVEGLKPDYRIIYIMREVEQLSTRETAESLQISEVNVKVKLHRAKEMLRARLEKFFTPEEIYEFGNERCSSIAANVIERLDLA